jgi:hypothetical protein
MEIGPALLVSVLNARNLRASDVETGKSDPVCFIGFSGHSVGEASKVGPVVQQASVDAALGPRTGVTPDGKIFAYTDCKNETINPEWNETFRFPLAKLIPSPCDAHAVKAFLEAGELYICVKDEDMLDKKSLRLNIHEEISLYRGEEDGAVPGVPQPGGRRLDVALENHRMLLARQLAEIHGIQKQSETAEVMQQKYQALDSLLNGSALQYDGLGTATVPLSRLLGSLNGRLPPTWFSLSPDPTIRRVSGDIRCTLRLVGMSKADPNAPSDDSKVPPPPVPKADSTRVTYRAGISSVSSVATGKTPDCISQSGKEIDTDDDDDDDATIIFEVEQGTKQQSRTTLSPPLPIMNIHVEKIRDIVLSGKYLHPASNTKFLPGAASALAARSTTSISIKSLCSEGPDRAPEHNEGRERVGCGVLCSVRTSWGVQSLTGSRWCEATGNRPVEFSQTGHGMSSSWRGTPLTWKCDPQPEVATASLPHEDADATYVGRKSLEARRSKNGRVAATVPDRSASGRKRKEVASVLQGKDGHYTPPGRERWKGAVSLLRATTKASQQKNGTAGGGSADKGRPLGDTTGQDGLVSLPLEFYDFGDGEHGISYNHHRRLHEIATAYWKSAVDVCVRVEDKTFGVLRYSEIGFVTLPIPWLVQACGVLDSEEPNGRQEQDHDSKDTSYLFEFGAWFPLQPSSFLAEENRKAHTPSLAIPTPCWKRSEDNASSSSLFHLGEVYLRVVLDFAGTTPAVAGANINTLKHLSLYKESLTPRAKVPKHALSQEVQVSEKQHALTNLLTRLSPRAKDDQKVETWAENDLSRGDDISPSIEVCIKLNTIRHNRNNSSCNVSPVKKSSKARNLVHVVSLGGQKILANWNWRSGEPLYTTGSKTEDNGEHLHQNESPPTTTLTLRLSTADVEDLARLVVWRNEGHADMDIVTPPALSMLVALKHCFDADNCMTQVTLPDDVASVEMDKWGAPLHPNRKQKQSNGSRCSCCCCCFQDSGHIEIPLAHILLGDHSGNNFEATKEDDSWTVDSWFPINHVITSSMPLGASDKPHSPSDIGGDAHLCVTVNGLQNVRESVRKRLESELEVRQPSFVATTPSYSVSGGVNDPSSNNLSSNPAVAPDSCRELAWNIHALRSLPSTPTDEAPTDALHKSEVIRLLEHIENRETHQNAILGMLRIVRNHPPEDVELLLKMLSTKRADSTAFARKTVLEMIGVICLFRPKLVRPMHF